MDEAVTASERAIERCDRLGRPPYSETEAGLLRRYLTPAHRAALEAVGGWMAEAGMTARLDPMANLIGRYEGLTPGAPALLIASHIDSVRNAGRYDGPLGVMLGIECVAALNAAGRRLPFAIEVAAFGDEEGSRFSQSMACSRAMAGAFDPALLAMRDGEGVTLAEALSAFGLDPARADEAARSPGSILAYLEPHIEQGPVLEAEHRAVAAVSGIAGQRRLAVRFTGKAGHAGTTPMHLRHDALAAAAEAVLAVESVCAAGPSDLVGTVGRIETSTALFNVIVGSVEIGLDIRAATAAVRDAAVDEASARIAAIAARRGIAVEIRDLQRLAEYQCDARLTAMIEAAMADCALAPRRLVSGAAHDAMIMGALSPAAMVFIRCAGGVSHNPAEAVAAADVAAAHRVVSAFVERLAQDGGHD